jgi:serine/threonine protein kinase
VHHPNSVQMLGACTKSKPYMLITEYVPGGSLAALNTYSTRPTLRRVLEISLDIARGMAYLHSTAKGIIHRDLKPSNILVGGSYHNTSYELIMHTGIIKIGDFGLSKSLAADKEEESASFQLTGGTGSYRFMAPEVFRHEPYNNVVDVYSFAMIMYQLIEGVVPYHGTKPIQAAVDAARQGRRPEWRLLFEVEKKHPEIAQKARAFIEQCWGADPATRPNFVAICLTLEEMLTMVPEDRAWGAKDLRGVGEGEEREEAACKCTVM